ncbi:unnamed protein product [Effrenium voratum]|uniref:FPL domain-containing protein n=1 Tax=Effrenium voratum TaxID=2562239 RepID=A0AA36MT73_9DINO|nr:unnamed protein product [Effrenium voratum]CAJ1379140.1 unnamed protein product [Effrenium voratum]
MSFFAGLFGWTSSGGSEASASSRGPAAPQPSYSFERLQQLYNRLAQFRESDLEKSGEGDALIETVRQITEALIWGEQTNNSQFFDFFCEKSIFSDLVHVLGLRKASKKVKLQLLQTLSMLIQNIHRQTSVYYILSNNHVNRLMSTNMDFDDEEVLAYYITLMKSLAMRLDSESIKFFFIQHPEPAFPLYIEATKFFSHKDHMVRATVRTITLQVYKIQDQPMRRFVLRHAAESYFSQLAYHLQDLWLRLNAAAAKVNSEEDVSVVQRENELQQDLQIYLSDVFELGIDELNEVLADRLLNGALLPVLLAGLSGSSNESPVRSLAPHVALFLIRQVLDTFHCPVLVEPLAQALLWSSVPAALAYVLPGQDSTGGMKEAEFVKNPLRDNFLGTLRSSEDRTFLMAAAVVHGCIMQRSIFSDAFLTSAQLLPGKRAKGEKKAAKGGSDLPEPLMLLLQAIQERTSWQLLPYMALARMLLEIVHADIMPSAVHEAAHRVTESSMKAAAVHVREVLQEAQQGEDAGAWLVDIFVEEWEQHKAGLPHLPEFFADPRRLAPARGGLAGRRYSVQRQGIVSAQNAVRSLFLTRRLLRGLRSPAPAQGEGQPWLRYSAEPLPLQLPEEASRPCEGTSLDLEECSCVGCKTLADKARQLILDPAWLVLAEPNPSNAVVTTVWPIWQVQSLIDRSDPRTLQIGMNAHKPGMKPGEAVAYNPPVSTYFTLTLNFGDVKACTKAAVHLQARRRAIRSEMLQKAADFVQTCHAGQDSSEHESPAKALESVTTTVF